MNLGYHNYDKYPFIKAEGKAYFGIVLEIK